MQQMDNSGGNAQQSKRKVIFVGAFNKKSLPIAGGQLYACTSLIKSPIADAIDFELVDSTMQSLPPPILFKRAGFALIRMFRFFYLTLTRRYDSALIFTAHGASFIEKGTMVLWARRLGIKTILAPRSGFIIDDIQSSAILLRFAHAVFRNADVIMCQSNVWKQDYQSLTALPQDRFVVIKNWLDAGRYLELPVSDKSTAPLRFAYLAWVERDKGIYELIDAVRDNKADLNGVVFDICGNGAELDAVKLLVQDYGIAEYFEFAGWVGKDEKLEVLRTAACFVLPSYFEGLPNALLEAMASGCAVIATTVGAIPDVVEHERNGLLVPPKDAVQLGGAIVRYAKDDSLRAAVSLEARQTIINQHQVENTYKDVEALL